MEKMADSFVYATYFKTQGSQTVQMFELIGWVKVSDFEINVLIYF